MKKCTKLVYYAASVALLLGVGMISPTSYAASDNSTPAECKVDCGAKSRCDKECRQKAQEACAKKDSEGKLICEDGIDIKHGCDSDGNCYNDHAACKKTKSMGARGLSEADPCSTPTIPVIGVPSDDVIVGIKKQL